jgi:MSHA biogenesis protein MshI
MRQQINLFQPASADRGKLLTAATTVRALGLVIALLAVIYAYGIHAVSKLANNVDTAREQQQKQTTLLASGAENAPHAVELSTLQAELKTINATLSDHRRAMQLLRVGAAGGDSGFSQRLIALAHQHIDEVWLNHIVLGSHAGVDSLGGNTTDAELIPRYLHNLAIEPALAGTRFTEFSIDGKNTVPSDASDSGASDSDVGTATANSLRNTIQFHAASNGATPAPAPTGAPVNTAGTSAAESADSAARKVIPIATGSS